MQKRGGMFGFLSCRCNRGGYTVRLPHTYTDICLYLTDTPPYIVSTSCMNHNILCLLWLWQLYLVSTFHRHRTGNGAGSRTGCPGRTACRGGRGAQGLTISEAVPVVDSFDALPDRSTAGAASTRARGADGHLLRRGAQDSGPRQRRTGRDGPGAADAPTVDRWTGRQQDGPDGAHRTAQMATGTEGRTGGRGGQGQRQTVTEGRRTGGRCDPGHGCGRA